MSAIAGILRFDGAPVEAGWIETLTQAMAPCGPDEQTHWHGGAVALGHCMLRTTPESLVERQPLASDDGTVVLVWDGRLDNREQLQQDLAATARTPRDASDAELVLQSYLAWGEQCPTRLLGDFALAVWDARAGRLFCARDHMGARPFFFTRAGPFLAFASEDEALGELPGVSHALDENRIAYLLVPTFMGFNYTHSWLKDVRAIGAAQSLTVSRDGHESLSTYWQLQPGPEARYASDEECQRAFLEVFGEAVRCRTRATGDIAVMQSGGLDSASIAVTARRLLADTAGQQLHSYSAISDQTETCIESRCILALTQDLGVNAHHLSVPSFTGMLGVEDLLETGWSKPHPVDNSLLLPAMMCRAAARSGHRVLLTGVCGDLTTHASYPYITALLKARRWRLAWHECRLASRNHTALQGQAPLLIFLRSFYRGLALARLKRVVRHLRSRAHQWLPTGSLISPALAERAGVAQWHAERALRAGPFLTDVQRAHILIMKPPHGIASSLGGYNRVAGKCGVELRDPWADRRVVEFWLRLPLKYKFRDGWTKYLVRAALQGALPAEVAWRVGKQHVGWNFFYRLMDESAGLVADTLEHGLEGVDNFVSTEVTIKEHAKYLVTGDHDTRERLFDLVTLVSWVRRHRQIQ